MIFEGNVDIFIMKVFMVFFEINDEVNCDVKFEYIDFLDFLKILKMFWFVVIWIFLD